ncbi:MAG: zinc ribbon domain-containing protein [Clostridiaceae bacterium]|nr:zinc ribbon domain-containing protein [Clostridiaceae bacterium]
MMNMINKNNMENKTTHLEEELALLEADLQAHYCQIGKEILDMVESEKGKINDLVDEIIKLKKKIAVLNNEIECPWCMAYNLSGSQYCKHCGEKLNAIERVGEE